MSLASFIFKNFWAKVISLILAIATWFYVFDLVNSDSFLQKRETIEDILSRYKFVIKEVPVKPVFFGKSPDGYEVKFDEVKIDPPKVSVFGPEEIINENFELKTDKIDLSEYTRNTVLWLGLYSDEKFLKIKGNIVKVTLSVVPVETVKSNVG